MNASGSIRATLVTLALVIGIWMVLVPGGRAAYGTPGLDGRRDTTYTTVVTGATTISVANDDTWFYMHVQHNETIESLTITHPPVFINITTNTTIHGVVAARFTLDRMMVEVRMARSLHAGTFALNNQTINHAFTLFPTPPEPEPDPEPEPFSLTRAVERTFWPFLLVASWVLFGLWLMSKRRVWLVRGEGSIKHRELGRWLGEEEVKLGGTPYWKHSFRDVLTGARREFYSDAANCRDVLYLKSKFNEYNMLFVELPYIRVGTMPLRQNQQFPKRVERKTARARAIKFLYYLLSWVPKVGDELYRAREFVDTRTMVTEVPYLYVTYEEDQLVPVHNVSWEERKLNDATQCEEWLPKSKRATIDEIAVLETQDITRKPTYNIDPAWTRQQRDDHDTQLGSIRNVRAETEVVTHVVRSFPTFEDALNDLLTREKQSARARYQIEELKFAVDVLNEKWESAVQDRERVERDRVGEMHKFIEDVNRNRNHYRDSVGHIVGHAAGLRDLGAADRTALDAAIRQAVVDAERRLRAEEQRGVRADVERIKKLEADIVAARRDLKRRSPNDLLPEEVSIVEQK